MTGCSDHVACPTQLAQEPLGVQTQLLASFGQAHATSVPHEQLGVELVFQSRNLTAQRGLGYGNRFGCAFEAADLGDFEEVLERADVHQ